MWLLNLFKKKPIRKTYKFLVRFSGTNDYLKENGFFNNPDAEFYGKSKGEIVQQIRFSNKYNGCSITSIKLE